MSLVGSCIHVLASRTLTAVPSQGTIHVNGRPRDMLWNRISAYVPQDLRNLLMEMKLQRFALCLSAGRSYVRTPDS